MSTYRYDIRDHEVCRNYQVRRRCIKICIFLVLCLFAWNPISAAIVLETPQTEVLISITDRKEARDNTPPISLQLPLCSIVVKAKHYGKGHLQIFHTPLVNEFEEVSYQVFSDNLQKNLPPILTYNGNPSLPLTIPMAELSANLARPLRGDRASYKSNIIVHLKLDV